MFMVATDDCLQKNNPMAMRLTKWSWKCKSHHWVLFSPHEFQSYLNRIRHPRSTSAQRIWSQPFTRYIRKWGKSLHKVDFREVDDLRWEREREREWNNCFSADSNCFSSANSIPVPQPMFDCSVLCGPSRLPPRSSMGKARVEDKGVLLQPYSHLWHTMKPPHILSKIPQALLPPSSQGKISVYFRYRELAPTVMNIPHSIFNLPSRKKKRFPGRENATTTLSIKISWIQIGHN
jgi:hypothetical protein